MMTLQNMTWQEIRRAADEGSVLLQPTGSLEQHGPHLPVWTDTRLVTEVAAQAAAQVSDREIVLAPPLWLGASHHHRCFFALSVSEELYVKMLADMASAAAEAGFRRFFVLNGHGGNSSPLRLALADAKRRNPGMLAACADYWSIAAQSIRDLRKSAPGGAAHAGELETSMMLHLENALVRRDRIEASLPDSPKEYILDLVDGGSVSTMVDRWDRLSEKGALGDPSVASAEAGGNFLRGIVDAVAAVLRQFCGLELPE